MSSTQIKSVVISPEILSLKGAKLPEKLMLAMYAADPATTLVRRALSITRAGISPAVGSIHVGSHAALEGWVEKAGRKPFSGRLER
jgi:hypothetical protein